MKSFALDAGNCGFDDSFLNALSLHYLDLITQMPNPTTGHFFGKEASKNWRH
jgi:hypothetical protein